MSSNTTWNYEENILKPFQYPFTKSTLLFRGARSTGKTYNMTRNIVLKAMQMGVSVLACRKTKESIQDSSYAEIIEVLDEFEIEYKATRNPLKITTTMGPVFYFRGLEDTNKIKSIKGLPRIGLVWIDEASENEDEVAIRKLMLSIRTGERYYVLTYNPEEQGDRHWLQGWEDNHGVNITTCFDNPYNDETFYEELEIVKRTNPKEYRKIAFAEWVNTGDDLYNVTPENITEDVGYHHSIISIGIDLGENDATTFVATGFDSKLERVVVLDQFYHSNADAGEEKKDLSDYTEEFALFLARIKKNFSYSYLKIYCENAAGSFTFRNLLKQKGINVNKVDKKLASIEDRVQIGRHLIDSNRLSILKDLPLIDALKNATRNPKSKRQAEHIRKDYGDIHSLDAFEYSIMTFIPRLSIPKVLLSNKTLKKNGMQSAAYDKDNQKIIIGG